MNMKHILLTTIAIGCLALLAGLSASAQNIKNNDMSNNSNKTLVAYFSATGTTMEAATKLAKVANADLHEIVPETLYTPADKSSRSSVEMADKSSRPAIANKVENMEQYDTVFVGYPIWWYIAPTIINTFLEQYDLTGKTIIPFATSGGSDMGKSGEDLKKASAPNANWILPGKVLNGNPPVDSLKVWVETLK